MQSALRASERRKARFDVSRCRESRDRRLVERIREQNERVSPALVITMNSDDHRGEMKRGEYLRQETAERILHEPLMNLYELSREFQRSFFGEKEGVEWSILESNGL